MVGKGYILRRLVVLSTFLFAGAVGTLGMSQVTPALAAQGGNGTGTANACAGHATNQGNSYAQGLQCAPTLVGSFNQATCTLTFTGSGLTPGSSVYVINPFDDVFFVGIVAPDGTFFGQFTYPTLPFSGSLVPQAYPPGTAPNTANPYFTGAPISFSCP
jgi:hypothetical protein